MISRTKGLEIAVSSFELLQGIAISLTMSLCVSLLLLGISLLIPYIHGNEVQTLLAFKSFITADPYGSLQDWTPNSPNPCNWTGISCCDRDYLNNCSSSSVQAIDLTDGLLEGQISSFIGNLSYLRRLDLHGNHFHGSIPASLGMLSELFWLELSDNSLSGVIPLEVGKMSSLEILSLSSNTLIGSIPASFANLSNLRFLSLDSNNLSGVIPSEVGKMSSLQTLSLSSNTLTGSIPASFANLSKLMDLYLDSNNLSGVIPSEVGKMSSLAILFLSSNTLTGSIPASFANLVKLMDLHLDSNNLSGVIPSEVGKMSSLEILSLSSNTLTGSIPSFQSLSLHYLDLSHNHLGGVIPIQNLSLHYLDLSHNHLGGVIPIQNLSLIYSLDLSHNHLSGGIPPFQNLTSLETLDLSYNDLRGVILIQNLSSIYSLDLSHNHLSGIIPPIQNLDALYILDLSYNHLHDVISIQNLSSIYSLDLSHNLLNSTIPFEAGFPVSVCHLDLSSNILTGIIPNNLYTILSDVSRGDQFCHCNLSHNALSGVLPLSLLSVRCFQLDLSYNDFEGSVPCIDNSTTVILKGNSRLHSNCTSNNKAKGNGFINKGKGRFFILNRGIVLGGLAALCLSGLLWWLVFRKLKSLQNDKIISLVDPKFIRLSEQQLAVATDNFSEHNLVGTGGSARVYRGVLPSSEFVAVKLFYGLDLEEDDQQRTAAEIRFLRECHTLGQIRHRNLVKIITACCGENIRALILHFMPNGNLHDLLHLSSRYGRLMPLSLRSRLLFIKDIASALSYLHNDCCPPIIHCDVKPHNVLLNEEMTACLSDFGMARILQTSDRAPSLRLEGSVGYIAPEYGTGVEPWSRGDVYSFGVVVLEVLTRTRPTDEEILGEQRLSEWVSMALMQGTEHWYPLICGREGQHEISTLSNANIVVLEELLKMGVWCCCQEPHARPTMREVEGLIRKICIEVVEEQKPLQLKSSLSGLLTSIDIKAQASKLPVSRSSTF